MSAYRDDLEAAQLRADTLERDLANDAGRGIAITIGVLLVGCAAMPDALATGAFVSGVAGIAAYAIRRGARKGPR